MKQYEKEFNPIHNKAHNRIMVQLIMEHEINHKLVGLRENIENPYGYFFSPEYWNWVLEPLRAMGINTSDQVNDFYNWVQENFPFGDWHLRYVKTK